MNTPIIFHNVNMNKLKECAMLVTSLENFKTFVSVSSILE